MSDISALLVEREKTHGDYSDHAEITQQTKSLWRSAPNWDRLYSHERETLEMLAHKIGRILSGDPHHPDHWLDCSGYAKLSADRNQVK